jgi:hypothetical protein
MFETKTQQEMGKKRKQKNIQQKKTPPPQLMSVSGASVKGQESESWTKTWSGYEGQAARERLVARRLETGSATLSWLQVP